MMVVECFIFIVFPIAKGAYLIVVFIWADILHYCPTGLFVFEVLCGACDYTGTSEKQTTEPYSVVTSDFYSWNITVITVGC